MVTHQLLKTGTESSTDTLRDQVIDALLIDKDNNRMNNITKQKVARLIEPLQ